MPGSAGEWGRVSSKSALVPSAQDAAPYRRRTQGQGRDRTQFIPSRRGHCRTSSFDSQSSAELWGSEKYGALPS
jgi:hypothetical protein